MIGIKRELITDARKNGYKVSRIVEILKGLSYGSSIELLTSTDELVHVNVGETMLDLEINFLIYLKFTLQSKEQIIYRGLNNFSLNHTTVSNSVKTISSLDL